MTPKPKTKVKTPKLHEEDRIKLIDRPELLLVVPKTHAASVRYGSGSKWCTALVGDHSYFDDYCRRGFLAYSIYYDVTDKNRRGQEKTKVGLFIYEPKFAADQFNVEGWSKNNARIPNDVLFPIVINDEINEALSGYIDVYRVNKYGYIIGSEIECNDLCGKFDLIKVEIKRHNWYSTVYLNPRDIGKCVVTKINEKSVRADIQELTLKTELDDTILAMLLDEINTGLNINIKNEFILQKK